MRTRKPAFAGSWYPGDAHECKRMIRSFLEQNRFAAEIAGAAAGGIVPHAGWAFSGDLACRVIAHVRGDTAEPDPDVVIVFGMHLPPGTQPVMMTQGAWQTPLGDIEIQEQLAEAVADQFSCAIETPDNFVPENTIELQLPFVKHFFPDSRVVTIGAPPSQTALELGRFAGNKAAELNLSAKVIGSTDLTHYGPGFNFTPAGTGPDAYQWVKTQNDRRVIDKMLEMDGPAVIQEGLSNQNACCAGAAAAAITASKTLGATTGHLVGYSSSYEKNPGSTFVGYGGIVYTR
ncbi:MAG: AmmeMemoRadiSam system protein B [Desulfosalsimonas sp.]|uniref:AmmeMemoRadiSam system protein B n=1 Tax=Desulfosalsimonas sp. TaxID=3073848 RepID=UPI0039705B83